MGSVHTETETISSAVRWWLLLDGVVPHKQRTVILTITLPWDILCPDNQKSIPIIRGRRPASVPNPKYRRSKMAIGREACGELAGFALQRPLWALDTRLWLAAYAYLPDARKTDPINYAKGVCDALEGIVYVNDNQIVMNGPWCNMGIDRENPRLVIRIQEVK